VNIVVDSLLTNYQIKGRGKVVLLLHGWGDNLHGLDTVANALASEYQVLSLDLPGFGKTEPPKEVWNLDNYAIFVNHFLDKLKVKDVYTVIGHSNGGGVAIRAISMKELQPKRLVLIASAGIRARGGLRRSALKAVAKTGNIATIWMPSSYRRSLQKRLYGVAGSDMLIVPELKETFKKSVRQDVQKDAANIMIPALIINATEDKAIPLEDGKLFAKLIENSTLEILESNEHFVHHDRQDEVNASIIGFLQ
jgi:pimeloyl-ACP methyl ester carboxylesterase